MLIYAHRGASWKWPELTESAYLAAVAEEADGFECDLRLSSDEIPVLWHNPTMQERAGNPGLIAEMKYEEILASYPEVLTLNEFLDIALSHKKSVFLETKHPIISINRSQENRLEEIIVKTLHDRKILDSIDLSILSFSWGAIEKMRTLDPNISRTLLLSSHLSWPRARLSSANQIGPGINYLRRNPGVVSKIHNTGKKVAIWTVDEEADIELCRDLGVDILITNKPAHARLFL